MARFPAKTKTARKVQTYKGYVCALPTSSWGDCKFGFEHIVETIKGMDVKQTITGAKRYMLRQGYEVTDVYEITVRRVSPAKLKQVAQRKPAGNPLFSNTYQQPTVYNGSVQKPLCKSNRTKLSRRQLSMASRLTDARLDRRLTIEQLAKTSGVTQSRIKAVEQGQTPVSVIEAKKLATVLRIDADYLIHG